jgi:hypothetical protein
MNLRVLVAGVFCLTGVLLALLCFGTFSNASAQANQQTNAQGAGQMKVIRAVHSDLSPPLRDQPVEWPQAGEKRELHVHPRIPIRHHNRPDPVIQSSFPQQLMTSLVNAVRTGTPLGTGCHMGAKLPLTRLKIPKAIMVTAEAA